MKNYKQFVFGLAVLVLLLALSSAGTHQVAAQEDLSFVYGTNHYNGAVYNSTFIPPSVDTMYLIADNSSMLASRFTQVYYWPLTNELKPDWDTANIVVDGVLEIMQNNDLIQAIDMTNYVIQYDAVDQVNTLKLYQGEEAVAARQNFESLQAQYREDLFAYYNEMNQYREEFQAALADLQAGTITEDQMPTPPEAQPDLTLFSTNLLVGFPVNLPEGKYTLQLRLPDGSIQADSTKNLVVFSPIREGIGYKIFSEERWNAPEESKDVNEIVYTLPGEKLYLEAYYQVEFNELYYVRMDDPQDTLARRDRNVWVPFEQVSDVSLKLDFAGSSMDIPMQDYYVRQIAGSALGYEIVPYEPDSDQDVTFSGFELDMAASEIHVQLVDEEGNNLSFGQRELRVLQTERSNWIFVLSSLPLVGGVLAVLLRRRSVNVRKSNEQEF